MPDDNIGSVFSISDDGEQRTITINTPPGCSFDTNADDTVMEGVEQTSSGGSISHHAGNLTQIGGRQSASNGGTITNAVRNGNLRQIDVDQAADSGGRISNQVINDIDELILKAQSQLQSDSSLESERKQRLLELCEKILSSNSRSEKVSLAGGFIAAAANIAQIASFVMELQRCVAS
jgi:hypothetical protein